MLLEGVYDLLSNDSGLQTLLGTATARADKTTGVFPGLAVKEATLPNVVMTQVGAEPVTSYEGNNRLQNARLRFSCQGGSYKTAKQVAAAVKHVLSGLLATLNDGTEVQGAWLVSEIDTTDEVLEGTVFSTHVDFSLQFVDND
jgi:Protein of unknown function (DUF3168)